MGSRHTNNCSLAMPTSLVQRFNKPRTALCSFFTLAAPMRSPRSSNRATSKVARLTSMPIQ